jgi:Flp pilus assembly protein TadG
MIRRRLNLHGCDEGAVAVEAAITLSSLLLLILGIIEFALCIWQYNTMLLAVSEAGRYVMINNATKPCSNNFVNCAETRMQGILANSVVCTTPTAGQTCVTASLKNIDLKTVASPTNGVTLTASYGFDFFGLLPGTFPISSGIWVPLD